MNRSWEKVGGFLFGLFGIVFLIIVLFYGLAVFSLEVTKIALFSQTYGELKVHIIDYVYLCVLFVGFGGFCRLSNNGNDKKRPNTCSAICGILIPLTFMILYTFLTKDEMGDIPFNCPADYPYSKFYSSPIIRTACQIRAANLFFLWFPLAAFFILMIAIIIGSCCYAATKEIRCPA